VAVRIAPKTRHAVPNKSKQHAHTDVGSVNGVLGGLEAQTDVLVPSASTLARSGGLRLDLRVLEDMGLLLESTLRLDGEFGSHGRCRDRRIVGFPVCWWLRIGVWEMSIQSGKFSLERPTYKIQWEVALRRSTFNSFCANEIPLILGFDCSDHFLKWRHGLENSHVTGGEVKPHISHPTSGRYSWELQL
jgi:hypothetical protein